MGQFMWIAIIVIAVLNLISFICYGADKAKAKAGSFRTSEATLLFLAVLGPVGALTGMYVFHHKTRKPKFFILVPLILIIETAILVFLYTKMAA